jgi:hypothetical protein
MTLTLLSGASVIRVIWGDDPMRDSSGIPNVTTQLAGDTPPSHFHVQKRM